MSTKIVDEETWKELNSKASKLFKEYAELKNRPKPLETVYEKDERLIQLEKDEHEKYNEFRSLLDNFEKKREYVLNLRKEVEAMKSRVRKDELLQKLKEQNITEKELLELHALNNLL